MAKLFSRKLATWHEAEEGGLTLGEHLARLPAGEVLLASDDAPAEGHDITQPELPSLPTQQPMPPESSSRRSRWLALAAVPALAALWALWSLWSGPHADSSNVVVSHPEAKTVSIRSLPAIAPPVTAAKPTPSGAPTPRLSSGRTKRRPLQVIRPTPPATPPPEPPPTQNKVRVWDPDSVLLPK